ncbi:MAG: DNA-directed RNA polymerase subunit B'', partial [Candidatus Heimdallarchaeota archaeon]
MKGFRAPVTLERTRDGSLRVSFPSVSRKISLIVLLRALGLEKDGAIARRIASTTEIQSKLLPILQAETVRNQEQALDYIGKRVAVGQTKEYRINRTEQVLDRYLLPHLGNSKEARIQKAYFLCLMAQRVLELEVGDRNPDDKDHYASKRLNLAGDLLLLLFRNAFRSLTRDIKYQLERNANKKGAFLKTAVRADVITERLRHALATGNWVGGKAGVSQLLDRTNYMSSLSHLRRVVSPLSRSQPHFEARDLHPTHWGKVCVVPDTLVLLDDGFSQIPIKHIEDHYDTTGVITIDKDSHKEVESSLIDFQRVSSYDLGKRVFEIQTITGRKIRATEDHPFLTQRGWVEVENLQFNDKLLVRPTLKNISNEEDDIVSI